MKSCYKHLRILVPLLVSILLGISPLYAHKTSEAFLTLNDNSGQVSFTIDVAVRDLQNIIDLDNNNDGKVNWKEVRSNTSLLALIDSHTPLFINQSPCLKVLNSLNARTLPDGNYLNIEFLIDCELRAGELSLAYTLFNGSDAQHRGLLKATLDQTETLFILDRSNPQRIIHSNQSPNTSHLGDYMRLGIEHIWEGWDHLLFLLTLLLPSVLIRQQGNWQPVEKLTFTLRDVALVVTAFTIAHSITLSLVSVGLVPKQLPGVEMLIAVSVSLAALHNVYPVFPVHRWAMAAIFGLIHGFGFAGALSEMGINESNLLTALFGFNLGVELGQLAVVLLFVPLIFILRKQRFYERVVLTFGSICISFVGLFWTVQRISG